MRLLCAIALFLSVAIFTLAEARATPADDLVAADAAFAFAQSKEQALSLDLALRAYERSEELAPLGAHAAAARARATFLRSHAEGNFAPLIALERVRRDPTRARDENALRDLGTQSREFPPGLVRVETWIFLAETYARRKDDDDALVFARLAGSDPAADDVTRTEAASLVADSCLRHGDTTCARDAANTPGVSTAARDRIERLARRRLLVFVAAGVLSATVAGWLLLLARARDRLVRPGPRALVLPGLLALVISACGLAASSFEGASPLPFVLLAFAVLLLSVLGKQVSSVLRGAAALRAASFALAVVAAAFLSLYASGPDYLTDFGL